MKDPMKLAVVGLILFLAGSGGWLGVPSAWARSSAEIREMIDEVLMERHPTDKPQWWKGLGPGAPGVIISMYENSSHTYQRLRLLQGLGWFDTAEAADFLKRQADASPDDVIRNTAIRSIGFSQGAKETDFIAKFLENGDPQTRYAAAETLKRLNDARANELLEAYLKKEKITWISQKLKGELPRPSGALVPVSTSEDRLAPEFAGEWQGFWLLPKGPKEKGMESRPALLRLKLESGGELKGELEVRKKKRLKGKVTMERWRLERISGKTTHITGVLASGAVEPKPTVSGMVKKADEFSFEADLVQAMENMLLEIRIRKPGAFLILRRDPSPID